MDLDIESCVAWSRWTESMTVAPLLPLDRAAWWFLPYTHGLHGAFGFLPRDFIEQPQVLCLLYRSTNCSYTLIVRQAGLNWQDMRFVGPSGPSAVALMCPPRLCQPAREYVLELQYVAMVCVYVRLLGLTGQGVTMHEPTCDLNVCNLQWMKQPNLFFLGGSCPFLSTVLKVLHQRNSKPHGSQWTFYGWGPGRPSSAHLFLNTYIDPKPTPCSCLVRECWIASKKNWVSHIGGSTNYHTVFIHA